MAARLPDVTNAAIDALVADSALGTLLGGAKVYSFIPENTAPPYVLVLGGREAPWVETYANDNGRQVDVRAECTTAYRGTKAVDAIASQVLTTLDVDSTYSGVTGYAGVQFVEIAAPIREMVDGVLWITRAVTVRVFLT